MRNLSSIRMRLREEKSRSTSAASHSSCRPNHNQQNSVNSVKKSARRSPINPRAELAQEADVVFGEEAQIGNAVEHDRDPLEAEPEGVAGIFLRIVADLLEH